MHDVRLRVDGQDYGGWTSVNIHRSLDQLAGTFDLAVTEKWPDARGELIERPVKVGQACQVLVDGQSVLTGYIDDVEPGYDKESREVSVKGRDKTGDLIDCSAVVGGWPKQTLTQIATILCAPFRIGVRADVDVGEPLPWWSVLPGETVFENLEKFARYKAVLLTTDGDGNLVIARASQERIATPLQHGSNILSASGAFSFKQRASVYTVTSHSIFQGNDQALTATISDAGVLRHRPITVIAEDMIAPVDWAKRAQWEASVRAARGTQIEVTVQGWRHGSGLWIPNRIVTLRAPWLGFDAEDLLISGVKWTQDDRGSRAVLTLTRPEAYSLVSVRLKGFFESAS